MPDALCGPADRVGNSETSVIGGKCEGTGFRREALRPPAEYERPSATPDPVIAGREATEVTLARGCDADVG